MLLIENPDGELLLEKRPDQGIWGGLWGFPECQPHEIDDTLNNLPLPTDETLSFRLERSGTEKSQTPRSLDSGLRPSLEMTMWASSSRRDDRAIRISELEPFRHTFTHFHLDITPIHVQLAAPVTRVNDSGRFMWYSPEAPQSIGLTRPVTKLIEQLR